MFSVWLKLVGVGRLADAYRPGKIKKSGVAFSVAPFGQGQPKGGGDRLAVLAGSDVVPHKYRFSSSGVLFLCQERLGLRFRALGGSFVLVCTHPLAATCLAAFLLA